ERARNGARRSAASAWNAPCFGTLSEASMATTIRRSLFFLLSALGAACGADRGTVSAPDGMSAMLDQAISENVRHADACRHATSLPDMLNDVTRHELAMNGITTRMTEA